MKSAFFLGRLIFGGFFLYNGKASLQHEAKATAHGVRPSVVLLKQRRRASFHGAQEHGAVCRRQEHSRARLGGTATGAALVLGGASVLLGVKPKLGAAAIAGFLAGVTPLMHDFWARQDPQQRMNDQVNFTKNMALGAALALMAVEEPWPASLQVAQPKSLRRLGKLVGRGRRIFA